MIAPFKNALSVFIASGFYTGLIPKWLFKSSSGGGLMGRFVATGISALIWFELEPQCRIIVTIGVIILTFLLGLITSASAANWYYNKFGEAKRHNDQLTRVDYNWINIDEIHGLLFVTLIICIFPFATAWINYGFFVIGFALFHHFDDKKTGLIEMVENIFVQPKNMPATPWTSLGVMVDDSVGGAMAAIIVMILMSVLHVIRALILTM